MKSLSVRPLILWVQVVMSTFPQVRVELTQDFEMAYYSREGAIWDRHRLEEGPTPTRYTR